jgi:hypothetical protein
MPKIHGGQGQLFIHGESWIVEVEYDGSAEERRLGWRRREQYANPSPPIPVQRTTLEEATPPRYTAVEAAEKPISLSNRSEEEVSEARDELFVTRVFVRLAPEGMPKNTPPFAGLN